MPHSWHDVYMAHDTHTNEGDAMFDSHRTVIDYLEAVLPELSDVAYEYGEPGYSLDEDATTPLIVLANYWCRCGNDPRDHDGSLHDVMSHYPQTFKRLESQGVVFEWLDEWTVDHEDSGKAYRTTADSYSWKPSYIYTESDGMLTPSDDLEAWLDEVADNPHKALPGHIYNGRNLIDAGFTPYNGTFEHGFHPGQDADPTAIDAAIRDEHEDNVTVVFVIDDVGQFDMAFTAYWRITDNES